MHDVPPPHLVSYAITRECNLKCKHCYSDAADAPARDELSTLESPRVGFVRTLHTLRTLRTLHTMRVPSLRRISGSSSHQSQPNHIVIYQPKVAHGRRQSTISVSRQARLPKTKLSFQQFQEFFLREPCLFDDGKERSSTYFAVPRHGEGFAIRRFQDYMASSLPYRLKTDLR